MAQTGNPTRWVVYHGDHVAFYYDRPTSGRLVHVAKPVWEGVSFSDGTRAHEGDELICEGCGRLPVALWALRWDVLRT